MECNLERWEKRGREKRDEETSVSGALAGSEDRFVASQRASKPSNLLSCISASPFPCTHAALFLRPRRSLLPNNLLYRVLLYQMFYSVVPSKILR